MNKINDTTYAGDGGHCRNRSGGDATLKTAILLLVAILSVSVAYAMTGTGTEGDPYIFENCADLSLINCSTNEFYELNNSIDCTGTNTTKICSITSGFEGHIDGNNYSIYNLSLYSGSWLNYLGNSTIDNLRFVTPYIYGDQLVGIFGYALNGAKITNVHIENGEAYYTMDSSGLLIGASNGGFNCGPTIDDCGARIRRCSVSGLVHGGTGLAGGIIGYGGSFLQIEDSWANVTVIGQQQIGGIIGAWNTGSDDAYLKDSYVYGIVNGTICNVGGLIGAAIGSGSPGDGPNVTTSHSYALIDAPAGCAAQGGLVGYLNDPIPILDSNYWDINTSGQTSMCGADSASGSYVSAYCNDSFGKTTSEMMTQSTFVGWDFVNHWDIDEGLSYPYLIWNFTAGEDPVCTANWTCSDYGPCNVSDLRPCNETTDTNSCGEAYTGDYSEFSAQSCDFCTPDWSCSAYGDCINETQNCTNVSDSNACYSITSNPADQFDGNYIPYAQGCTEGETPPAGGSGGGGNFPEAETNVTALEAPSSTGATLNYAEVEAYLKGLPWYAWVIGIGVIALMANQKRKKR